jgi:general L-amino acid transport system permease protein
MAHQTGVSADADDAGRVSLMNDPKARGLVFQALLIIAVIFLVYSGVTNAIDNLARAGIASGLGFFGERAGFDIGQSFIPYTNDSTYLRAFFVGLLNTMVVAIIGIFFATVIGFVVGLARLSKNYLVRNSPPSMSRRLRNIPLLLQLLFWYKACSPSCHRRAPAGSSRARSGVQPWQSRPVHATSFPKAVRNWSAMRFSGHRCLGRDRPLGLEAADGDRPAVSESFFTGLGTMIVLPLLAFLVTGMPLSLEYASLGGFRHGAA